MTDQYFGIAAVERDTGLSKDVLRVWERRYGFPTPIRDANDERCYTLEQVKRLRLIKRLMDLGHRPGKLIDLAPEELAQLAPRHPRAAKASSPVRSGELAELIILIKSHDLAGYQQAMQRLLARNGLQEFVLDTVAPLSTLIGEEWERGTLQIFEEHLFTELTKRLLRQAIASLPFDAQQQRPRILLTSVPGEQHALGLLMAEAMFALEGAQCVPLGTEMPLLEIASAVTAHQADVIALSFSASFPQRQISERLRQLRMLLPNQISLWAGGSGAQMLPAIEGIQLLQSLESAQQALKEWQQTNAI